MFAHLKPHSSDFRDVCALYSPFLHRLIMQTSLFEPVVWAKAAYHCGHTTAAIPLQPYYCSHTAAAIPLRPYHCGHTNTAIPLRPYDCSHSAAAIALRPYHCGHTTTAIPLQPYHCGHTTAAIPLQPYHCGHTSPRCSCYQHLCLYAFGNVGGGLVRSYRAPTHVCIGSRMCCE